MRKEFRKRESTQLNYINYKLARKNIIELNTLLGTKKEIFLRNFIGGIAKGVGIGIGVTLITAIVIYVLQKIVRLNIPLFGEYLADIMDIISASKSNNVI